MHSDLEQKQRDEVMLAFKAGRIDILVATDIVARGIDIDDIKLVINYDVPHDAEDYVHRIGRTARAGREGSAVTLVGERDVPSLREIENLLEIEIPRAVLPEGFMAPSEQTNLSKGRHADRRRRKGGSRDAKKEQGRKQGGNRNRGNRHSKPSAKKADASQVVPENGKTAVSDGQTASAETAENKTAASKTARRSRHHRRRKTQQGVESAAGDAEKTLG